MDCVCKLWTEDAKSGAAYVRVCVRDLENLKATA
jgi:hypothetical protein